MQLIKIILILLFLGCLGKWHYDYYLFVRYAGMIGFGLLAIDEKQRGNNQLFMFFLFSAILINPFVKVVLGRQLWQVIDVVWAIILSVTLFSADAKRR